MGLWMASLTFFWISGWTWSRNKYRYWTKIPQREVTWDGIELGLSEFSNDGTIDGNFNFLLYAWLGWLVWLKLGTNDGYKLVFWGGRVLVTINGAVNRLPLGTCDSTVLGCLEGIIYGAVVGKFESLLIGTWHASVVGFVLVLNEGNELCFWDRKVLDRTLGDPIGI